MTRFSTCLLILLGVVCIAQAFVPLSRNSSKEQIFVGGNWYNKDGTTDKPYDAVTPHAFFQQCLHHENSTGCDTTWQQRYWVDQSYYQQGGPVFIEIAGEWDASGDINGGYWFEYAAQYNALVIVLEHRFYGGSFPVQNPTNSDLWLMTSQLALADAARFIQVYTASNGLQGANWVTFGCSYGANLAAWMKLKYPELIKTAVSSSGPVEAVYDYPGYTKTISEVIQAVDPFCYGKVSSTFGCIEALVNGSASNCLTYNSADELLVPLRYPNFVDWENSLSKEIFFGNLAYSSWANNNPEPKVRADCTRLHNVAGANDIEKYGNFYADRAGGSGSSGKSRQQELEERKKFLQSKEAWQSGAAAWDWQTCNEFGYYMEADPELGTFGYETFSGDYYGSSCLHMYGAMYTRDYVEGQVANTNDYYGGKGIPSRCVIFVHGTWDPWHTQGVTDQLADNTVIVVPRTAHCADNSQATTIEMQQAQEAIMAQIGTYLNDPNC